jgi:hypothetical protein
VEAREGENLGGGALFLAFHAILSLGLEMSVPGTSGGGDRGFARWRRRGLNGIGITPVSDIHGDRLP